ncbi:phosphonate ABC transporter, permease protein PhnE [Candidatus Xianfuyuplasma coldseepsis]|uniref:Phosphonate ABC transporter, permease protein PhnE n=2 Tax=Candidatus Xianfuyuplasma coldseepsis TaxID=2782163 RepID=A0A7L7KW98_9MOLU|nr:phosphonate ABC transporter, permease protein PhnE [Xianfuyuplasma coldseepsis]
MQPNASSAVLETYENAPRKYWAKIIAFVIVFSLAAWSFDAINFGGINNVGFSVVRNILRYFVNPNYKMKFDPEAINYIQKYFFSWERYAVPYLMVETIMIAILGTFLGAIISIPFAFLSSKNITGEKGSWFGATLITMIRTVPIFVWGIVFIRVQGGAMAGVLAISVSSIGMISKLYIEVIEDIDTGILEALDSTGATTFQKIRFGIIPQLTASFLSTAIYRFEINVKNAAILGMVGAGGIGFTLIDALGSFNFPIVAVCLWGIIPVVLAIEYLSTWLRSKLAQSERS